MYVLDNNLLDTILKNVQLVLHLEDSLYSNDNDENNYMVEEQIVRKEFHGEITKHESIRAILEKDSIVLSRVERNFLMALVEIMTMVIKMNVGVSMEKLIKNDFEKVFFRVLKIEDSNVFDVLFEMICPNFDPLFEPNLVLVEYLIEYLGFLKVY